MFVGLIESAAFLFGVLGAVLIVFGGIRAGIKILSLEVLRNPLNYQDIRQDFTSKIVFGLEFFIAADILKTLIAPTKDEIIILGAVVLIRTILGYFLSKESREFQMK